MAALDFPSSPTVGQIYTANGKSWQWDGVSWNSRNTIVAAGSNTQIQYNNSGAFGASSSLTWNNSTSTLSTVNLSVTGNTTLGDANTDTLTINGTAVSIPNSLNFDSNTLFIDATNNRVGIGTNSPGSILDVRTAAGTAAILNLYAGNNTTASKINFGQTGSIGWNSGITATNGFYQIDIDGGGTAYTIGRSGTAISYHAWSTSGTECLRIDSAGNVGIGASFPGYKLDVVGQVRSNPSSSPAYILAAGGTNLCSITSGSVGAPGMALNSSREVIISTGSLSSPTGYHLFGPNGGLNIGFSALNMYSIPVNGMSIAGSVGIGKDIPEAKLHVVGTLPAGGIYVESSAFSNASPVVRVRGGRNDTNGSQAFSGGLVLERYSSASQITSGNTLGTIYFGGNYSGSSFGYSASISAIASANWSSTTTANTDLVFFTGSTAQTSLGTANVNYGTERLRIDSAGNVGIGTSSPGVRLDISGQFRANPAGTTASVIAQNTGGTAAFELIDGAATPNRWWLMSGLGTATDGIFSIFDRRQSISRLAITTGGVVTIGSAISLDPTTANALVVNSSGNVISTAPATPPSLSTNGTMVFNLTSNTNLRVSVRGTDGVTRTANITLA